MARSHVDAVTAWEQLGEAGREDLLAHLVWVAGGGPIRHPHDGLVLTDVSAMTCTAHPLERVAAAYGCDGAGCCDRQTGLGNKRRRAADLVGGDHAVSLVRAFLASPHLAFPPDIPGYALRCHAWVQQWKERVATRAARKVKAQLKAAAEAAHKQAVAARAVQRAKDRTTRRASYPARIERAEKKEERAQEELRAAERRVVRLRKKCVAAKRSVDALRRAAAARGETPP
jgi:hypothetical protein